MTKYLKFIVFTTFMIGSTEASYADFGFIQDKDGYVNVRENSSLSSKVTTKLNNNEIISCVMDEETNNFCLVNARALLHKDLKCKAPLIEPNLRRNLCKWST